MLRHVSIVDRLRISLLINMDLIRGRIGLLHERKLSLRHLLRHRVIRHILHPDILLRGRLDQVIAALFTGINGIIILMPTVHASFHGSLFSLLSFNVRLSDVPDCHKNRETRPVGSKPAVRTDQTKV